MSKGFIYTGNKYPILASILNFFTF